MHGIDILYTYIWLIFIVNAGKHTSTIHGWYGVGSFGKPFGAHLCGLFLPTSEHQSIEDICHWEQANQTVYQCIRIDRHLT